MHSLPFSCSTIFRAVLGSGAASIISSSSGNWDRAALGARFLRRRHCRCVLASSADSARRRALQSAVRCLLLLELHKVPLCLAGTCLPPRGWLEGADHPLRGAPTPGPSSISIDRPRPSRAAVAG